MLEVSYQNSLENIETSQLEGFFVGWPSKPSTEKHLELLGNSDFVTLATANNKVVGFITAVSDKVLSAYIPFLEVIPDYQNKGVGKKLVEKMLEQLNGHYMIDLLCDAELQNYYEQFEMKKSQGMSIRNYEQQSGM